MPKVTAPGVLVASAKATAITSYSAGTSRSRSSTAGLSKLCQYPVRKCLGSPEGGGLVGGRLVGGVVGVVPPPQAAPFSVQLAGLPEPVARKPNETEAPGATLPFQ